MTSKGENTKRSIIEISEQLFAEKGYSVITMKDICEACDMSRGGLYRHFASTKEIFIAMLDKDILTNREALDKSVKNNAPAKLIFEYYLNQELDAIISPNRGIFFAIHEFAFLELDQRQYFKDRLKKSIEILSILFDYGKRTGEFKSFDTKVVATHILYIFDSLKTTAAIFDPSREVVENQVKLIKELVI